MAEIVLGFGSSHGPTMQTPAEEWDDLDRKDQEDPRFDYQGLLRLAPPNIADELTIDVKRRKYAACLAGIQTLRGVLEAAAPDAIVIVSNPHGAPPNDVLHPPIGIYLSAAESRLERTGQETGGRRGDAQPVEVRQGRGQRECANEPALADQLMRSLRDEGIDIACEYHSRPGAVLGHEYHILHSHYMDNVPMVPIVLSRYLPNQATPRRCWELGAAIRRAIEGWDSNKRVAVMASGGLSHQIVDEELDRQVVDALMERDADFLRTLSVERLNRAPGTAEILNWVTVASTMEELPMTLVDYVPCYRSPAATGHGVTFGYWK